MNDNKQNLTKQDINQYTIFSSIPDAFFLLSNDFKFLYVNAAAEKLVGIAAGELINESIYEMFGLGDDHIFSQILIKALYANTKSVDDFFSSSAQRWLKITSYTVDDGLALFVADNHEEKVLNDTVNQREIVFKKAFDALPNIAFVAKPNGENIYLNRKGQAFTSSLSSEGKGINWKNLIHPEDYKKIINGWVQSKFSSSLFEGEYRLRDLSGDYRWHYGTVIPLKDEKDEISSWFGTATDIHKQKEAEKELKESEYFIYQVTDSIPDFLSIYDIAERSFSYANQQFILFLGYNYNGLKSMELAAIQAIIHPDFRSDYVKFHEDFAHASDTEIRELEYKAQNVLGEWRWLKSRGKVYDRSEDGKVSQFIATTQDITDRKEGQDKNEEVRQLKGLIEKKEEYLDIVSHELKTPITSIKASLQIIKRLATQHTDESTLLVFISKTNQQVNRLAELLKELAGKSARQPDGEMLMNLSVFDMREVVLNCVNIAQTEDDRIIVRNSVKERVEADRSKIEQVLLNFITNACKFSPKGKEVYIDIKKEDSCVKVSVTDGGIGIPEDVQNQVFERYFRASNISTVEGQGLGLYISAEIVKQHKGKYGVISQIGQGSTFWFKIPFSQTGQ